MSPDVCAGYTMGAVLDCAHTACADTVHDRLFGDVQWSATTAAEDTRDPPRRVKSAGPGVEHDSFDGSEGEQAANDHEMQAWTLSSLEAVPLEASSVAATNGIDEADPMAGIWRRLSPAGHSAAHSGVQLPSGFVVDDLQSASAALPLRASATAASSVASSGRAVVETVHDLHDPKGRGTGALAALSATAV